MLFDEAMFIVSHAETFCAIHVENYPDQQTHISFRVAVKKNVA